MSAGPAQAATAAAIARVQRIDPQLHSVIALDPTAMAQAQRVDAGGQRGPLAGQPVLLKDNIEAAGPLPTTAGSLALADNVTNRDAPLVARLRAAGAVILGKTNLSEWANIRSTHSISGWSAVGGQTHNPYALDRNTCGSSSGSGAAVAAGLVRFAIGTETDGSVTCPASINGIVGLKPTVGLVSRTYIVPISHSQDTAGPMTETVRDAAELLTVIAGSDPADPATRDADRHRTITPPISMPVLARKAARRAPLRFVAYPRPSLRHRAGGSSRAGRDPRGHQDLRPEGHRRKREPRSADRAQSRHGQISEEQPGADRVRTLADLIAFDKAHERQEMGLFGQEYFEQAEKTKGLSDPEYRKARAASFQAAGPNGIDRLLRQHKLVALVGPLRGRPGISMPSIAISTPKAARATSRRSPAIRT